MIFYDYESDDDLEIKNEADELLEEEMDFVLINYKCEDCDYRWQEKKKPHITDEDKTGTYIEVDDDDVICPICGSTNVTVVDV
jgi:Zn finger protein HypA/HybF involved in hydrogenase expression